MFMRRRRQLTVRAVVRAQCGPDPIVAAAERQGIPNTHTIHLPELTS